ncbi:hypothetical protein OGAPHI_004976 [Ogataea philodendri]|uniref:adenosine kinase n=1 Tax=Ogataea philodendri TaxID=1378263 RepID=A0A9P8T329_9ASCO|nr:uncharacterized protein OGAPHI_004976 [Ogataea philodendri]KAH3663575.1 hypothetical protein OGAPHI_004976 [Ogataea philodendri]
MSFDLVCLGNPLLDLQVNVEKSYLDKYDLKEDDAILIEDKHLPIFDEVLARPDVRLIAGGAAQNTARGAQYLLPANSVLYFGSVGKDKYAERLLEANKSVGLTTAYMVQDSIATGKCAALINGPHRSLVTDLAAANHFKPSHLEKPENWEHVKNAKFFYIGGFHLTVSPEAIELLGKHAAEEDKPLLLNFSAPFIPQFFKEPLLKVLPYVDYVICNESEAAAYAEANGLDSKDLVAVAKQIADSAKANTKRARTVVFTQGTDPTLVVEQNNGTYAVKEYPVHPLEASKVTDTNGAGDAFAAGFVAGLVQNKDLATSVDIGHWLARLSIQEIGPSYPFPKQSYHFVPPPQQLPSDASSVSFQTQPNKYQPITNVSLYQIQQPVFNGYPYQYENPDFGFPEFSDYSRGYQSLYLRSPSFSLPSKLPKSEEFIPQVPSRLTSMGASQLYIPPFEETLGAKPIKKQDTPAFVCRTCGKVFPKPYNLKSHQKTHSDEKPFPCQYCSKPFARSHDRRRHERLHENDKKLKCGGLLSDGKTAWGCNRKFARPDALRRHFRTETGIMCIRPLMVDFRSSKQTRRAQDSTRMETEYVINEIAREAATEVLRNKNSVIFIRFFFMEEQTCRICRCEGTDEDPLFHPCKCRGSIKYIHQDCLMSWLQHSRKTTCDICHTKYAFRTVYDSNAPERPPIWLILQTIQTELKTVLYHAQIAVIGLVMVVLQIPVFASITARIYTWLLGCPVPHENVFLAALYGAEAPDPNGWLTFKNLETLEFASHLKGIKILLLGVILIAASVAVHEWVSKDEGFTKIIEHNIGPEFTAQKLLQMLQQPRNQLPRRPELRVPRRVDPLQEDEEDDDELDAAQRARIDLDRALVERQQQELQLRRIRQLQDEQRGRQGGGGGGENVLLEFVLTPMFLIKVAGFFDLMVLSVLGVFYFVPSLLGMIAITALHSTIVLLHHLSIYLYHLSGLKIPLHYTLPSLDLSVFHGIFSIYSNIVNWTPQADFAERTIVAAAGYAAVGLAIAAVMYRLESGCSPVNPLSRGYRAVYILLLEVVCTIKVMVIFCIELLVLPVMCGYLLSVMLCPLFLKQDFADSLLNNYSFPMILGHAAFGTGFLYMFASFVSMIRSQVLRKGVLFFIRSPDDPNVRPIHDALMRPFGLQMSRIALSALVYCIYIAIEIGLVVYGGLYLFPLDIFPLASEYTSLLPFIVPLLRMLLVHPTIVRMFSSYWHTAFKYSCSLLRLSSFILGSDVPSERGSIVYRSVLHRFTTQKPDYSQPVPRSETRGFFEQHPEISCCFVPDGTFVRAPDDDNVSHSFIKKLFVPVTKNDIPLVPVKDDDDSEAKRNPYGDEELVSITSYTIVYRPPRFTLRVYAFLGCLWLFSLALTAFVFSGTLMFAKLVFYVTSNYRLFHVILPRSSRLDVTELFLGHAVFHLVIRGLDIAWKHHSADQQSIVASTVAAAKWAKDFCMANVFPFLLTAVTISIAILSWFSVTVLPILASVAIFENLKKFDIEVPYRLRLHNLITAYSFLLGVSTIVYSYLTYNGNFRSAWKTYLIRNPGYVTLFVVQAVLVGLISVASNDPVSLIETWNLLVEAHRDESKSLKGLHTALSIFFTWLPWSLTISYTISRAVWRWLITAVKNQHYGKKVYLTNNEDEDGN